MLVSRFLPWPGASLRRNKNIVYLIIRTSKLEIWILMSSSPFGLARDRISLVGISEGLLYHFNSDIRRSGRLLDSLYLVTVMGGVQSSL